MPKGHTRDLVLRSLLSVTKDGVRASDVEARIADRDRRQALDDRTAAERWLGDPPRNRSALAEAAKK